MSFKNAMKKSFYIAIFFTITSTAFGQVEYGKPEIDPITIQKNFNSWLDYQNKNIFLSTDFIALDSSLKEISKDDFLNQLTSGEYIPIKLTTTNSLICYQLYKILPSSDTSIKASLTALAIEEYEHYKMEGTPFPEFNFKDLNGNTITTESLKGKIVVIKCWFIHCAPCIKEFPAVNKLVTQYKSRKDIVFISLSEDTAKQLQLFLIKKSLLFSTIPNMKKYMNETLHLSGFPTHFILNKKGQIAKVLMNYESLELALKKESQL